MMGGVYPLPERGLPAYADRVAGESELLRSTQREIGRRSDGRYGPINGMKNRTNVSLDPLPPILAASTAQVVSCPPAERADPGLLLQARSIIPVFSANPN